MQERKLVPAEDLYREYEQVAKWAVIVGVSQYQHRPWNLNYAHRDAEQLYQLLLTDNGGNFKEQNICKLLDQDATKRNIEIALHDFLQKPDQNDLVVLYFACHGAPDPRRPNNNLYLLTYDTEPTRIAATGLRMREIDYALRDTLIADKVIIFADTCHSGGIGGNIGNRSVSDHSELVNRYLNSLGTAKPGVALLSSAETREVSRESKQWGGGHGVFTHFVLEGMGGNADSDNDGIVTVGELFEYVRENVKQETDKQQHPSIGTNEFDRNLPIAITDKIKSNSQADSGVEINPLEEYRQKVQEMLADRPLNPISKFQLENLYKQFGIAKAEAKDIVQAEWQKIESAKENFQKILKSTIEEGYNPLNPKIKQQLEDLQATLQLTDLEVEGISDSILEEQAKTYFQQGNDHYEQGEYQKAIADYTEAIRLNPEYAEAYNNRGSSYHALKEYEKAIADYTEAIRLNPEYADAYNNRGISYRNLKEYQKAIADYTEAIRLNPEYVDAYNNRGISYRNLKEYQKAIADYNEALRLNPEYATAYHNRGFSYDDLKEYEKAIADYNEALRLNPEYATAYHNRGISYHYLKEDQKAIADYNEALRLNPEDADAYHNRGISYRHLKEEEKAIADYTEAIRLNPQYATAYYNRGDTYQNLKDNKQAIKDFQQAADLYKQQGKTEDYQDSLIDILPPLNH